MNKISSIEITIGDEDLTLNQIVAIARGKARVSLSLSSQFRDKLERSRKALDEAMKHNVPVYGVTTGYGKSCGKRMAREAAIKNGANLVRFHGCGTGEILGIEETRAAMLARILCFARGYSGVSFGILEKLAEFLNHGITPVVPCEGSVGASGDLTPMSYVAAALTGERDVHFHGKKMPAREALAKAGIEPYVFAPKEPLGIMNGTATMTGIAALVVDRARRLFDASIAATALSIHALMGNRHHYHPSIGKAKPHPGQVRVARILSGLLETSAPLSTLEAEELDTLQDPYSLRCSPQILGVLSDSLEWITRWVEIEANSGNDNPVFDPDSGEVLMGGNFYGGHLAFAMDSLKAALASASDMSDRQIALMVNPNVNRGLPADLVRIKGPERLFNHGFKAISIASSSLTAEALKLTMPAASFSRSTESHNQDKVSMGTIAARDADRICTLAERILAMHLLAAAQACEIRDTLGQRPRLADIIGKVRAHAPALFEDRPMDSDIENLAQAISKTDLFRLTDE